MRPIAELLDFLTQTMTLMTVYRPAMIASASAGRSSESGNPGTDAKRQ